MDDEWKFGSDSYRLRRLFYFNLGVCVEGNKNLELDSSPGTTNTQFTDAKANYRK